MCLLVCMCVCEGVGGSYGWDWCGFFFLLMSFLAVILLKLFYLCKCHNFVLFIYAVNLMCLDLWYYTGQARTIILNRFSKMDISEHVMLSFDVFLQFCCRYKFLFLAH